MAQFLSIHPTNPQPRLIEKAVQRIQEGALIVYPSNSGYALGCQLDQKSCVERIRHLRGLDENHHFTLVCNDLSQLGTYARVDNRVFRMLKSATPGPYTFILEATREVPKRLCHPKKSTIGLRIPEHPIAQALLKVLGEPLLSSTLILPGQAEPPTDAWTIQESLERDVELVIDGGYCTALQTTVINLSGALPELVRQGVGSLAPFGL